MSFRCKLSRLGILVLFSWAVWFSFARPDAARQSILEGYALCTGPLLCGLFPFMVLSRILLVCDTQLWAGRFLSGFARLAGVHNKNAGSPLLLAWTGGFAPACTALNSLCDRGQLSAAECTSLLPLCLWVGPSFAVLTLGDVLGSRWAGWCLYIGQFAAGMVCTLLGRMFLHRKKAPPAESSLLCRQAASTDFSQAIGQAAVSYLQLCGCVVFFRFLAAGADGFPPPWNWVGYLLEISSGGIRAAEWGPEFCSGILSLLGVCILVQARTLLPRTVSLMPFLLMRPVHCICAVSVVHFLLRFAPVESIPAYASLAPEILLRQRCSPVPLFLLFLLLCRVAALLSAALHWKTSEAVL